MKENTKLSIRKTTSAEFDHVMEIVEHGRVALAEAGVDQWNDGYPSKETVARDIEREVSYTVLLEDRPVATAVILTDGESDYDEIKCGRWLQSGSYITVHRVATHKGARRTGAASFIIREAERIARSLGYPAVRIDTHRDNLVMQAFLAKNGFQRCGIIHLRRSGAERIAFEKLLT